jgi:N,N'-diacetyllegionaminate synthase
VSLEIVAEIAQGFEGDSVKSSLLLKSAANAGADAAKFQMVYADELATEDYKFHSLFQSLEMGDRVWRDLFQQSVDLDVELQVDIFGLSSLEKSVDLGIKTVKIHPTDVSNISLLTNLAESPIHRVLLGVGGAHSSEIEQALAQLVNKQVVLLLGFQGYPTETHANQLARIPLFAKKYCQNSSVTIGFADHADPESGLAQLIGSMSIGAGATLVEKHLTLNRALQMEDHESALNPDEFADYSKQLRLVVQAYGTSHDTEDFAMTPDEAKYRSVIRRHVVASVDIQEGQQISPFDVTLKRSSVEDPITDLLSVYGKQTVRSIKKNSPIRQSDLAL